MFELNMLFVFFSVVIVSLFPKALPEGKDLNQNTKG